MPCVVYYFPTSNSLICMVNVGRYTMHGCYGHDGQVFVGTFCIGSLIQPFPWKSSGSFLEWLKNSLYPAPHTDPVQMSNEKQTACLGCIGDLYYHVCVCFFVAQMSWIWSLQGCPWYLVNGCKWIISNK